MDLVSERQWANTKQKLALIESQIAEAKSRPDTQGNRDSIESLVKMANQLREEITRYEARQKRRAL